MDFWAITKDSDNLLDFLTIVEGVASPESRQDYVDERKESLSDLNPND